MRAGGETGRRAPVSRHNASAERIKQLLGLRLLCRIALLHDFLQDFARAVLVTHFLVRLGEIELRLHVVPVIVLRAAWRWPRGICLGHIVEAETDIVELDVGSRR